MISHVMLSYTFIVSPIKETQEICVLYGRCQILFKLMYGCHEPGLPHKTPHFVNSFSALAWVYLDIGRSAVKSLTDFVVNV
jgi:hypothetical protein